MLRLFQSCTTEPKATMPIKREIISVMPLPSYPGHWLLKGRTEDEFGIWYVVRKPNRTYCAAVMPNGSEREPLMVELGANVEDSNAVLQFEAGFTMLQQNVNPAQRTSSPAA